MVSDDKPDWRVMAQEHLEARGYMNVTKEYLKQKAVPMTNDDELLKRLDECLSISSPTIVAGDMKQAAARIRELKAELERFNGLSHWLLLDKMSDRNLGVRFLSKIRQCQSSGCWVWIGSGVTAGYGQLKIGQRQNLAHRLSYQWFVGSIPKNCVVMHKCDNPSCVNPDHLKVGTSADNSADMVAKGRQDKNRCGDRNPQARLQEDDALSIIQSNDCAADLARQFGVSTRTVTAIKSGKRWAYLHNQIRAAQEDDDG